MFTVLRQGYRVAQELSANDPHKKLSWLGGLAGLLYGWVVWGASSFDSVNMLVSVD